jgi:hypothetical protein
MAKSKKSIIIVSILLISLSVTAVFTIVMAAFKSVTKDNNNYPQSLTSTNFFEVRSVFSNYVLDKRSISDEHITNFMNYLEGEVTKVVKTNYNSYKKEGRRVTLETYQVTTTVAKYLITIRVYKNDKIEKDYFDGINSLCISKVGKTLKRAFSFKNAKSMRNFFNLISLDAMVSYR